MESCTSSQCYFTQSHIHRMHACLAVTCHLHVWQNARKSAVLRGSSHVTSKWRCKHKTPVDIQNHAIKGYSDSFITVSKFGLAVRRWAGKQKDLGSIPLRLSFFFKKGCGLLTLSRDFVPHN